MPGGGAGAEAVVYGHECAAAKRRLAMNGMIQNYKRSCTAKSDLKLEKISWLMARFLSIIAPLLHIIIICFTLLLLILNYHISFLHIIAYGYIILLLCNVTSLLHVHRSIITYCYSTMVIFLHIFTVLLIMLLPYPCLIRQLCNDNYCYVWVNNPL